MSRSIAVIATVTCLAMSSRPSAGPGNVIVKGGHLASRAMQNSGQPPKATVAKV